MRRTLLLLATLALAVLLASGVALAATFRGTDGNDTIVGTEESDQIFGRGGNDILGGGKGDDIIFGGPGKDRGQNAGTGDNLESNGSGGGLGNDIIHLGPGDDGTYPGSGEGFEDSRACPSGNLAVRCEFEGGPGDDVMFGEGGDDEMNGDSLISDVVDYPDPRGGSDTIHGGDGSDTIYGNVGADKVYGDGGRDYLDGQDGENTLYGGPGNDVLATAPITSSDVLYGGAGDDELIRGGLSGPRLVAADTFYGGDGDDKIFAIEGYSKGEVYYAGDGNDRLLVPPVVDSGKKHRVYCGSGYDIVEYDGSQGGDRADIAARDCEKVTRLG